MRDGATGRGTRVAGERPGATRPKAPGARRARNAADADEAFRELVRLAYFVLPGRGKRPHRMALARRIVESTGGAGGGHERRRTRVLRRAMKPHWVWRLGLRRWLRATPPRMPAGATTNALAELEPPVRVAYALLNVARMSRHEARDQLLDLRIPDQMDVIAEAERAKVPVIRTWPHSDPFGPGRIQPLGHRSPMPVGVAVVLTAVLAGTLLMVEDKGRLLSGTSKAAAAHGLSLVSAAPDTWRTAPHSLDVWPARGDLTGDERFTGRALNAWADAAKTSGAAARPSEAGNPQLLFAGHVDGRKVALVRRGDRIGRFADGGGPMTVYKASTDAAAPIRLSRGRYLVAPWHRPVSLTGKRVTVRQGVTDPVFPRTRCGRGPVLHLREKGGTRTVGEFGGARGVPLTYRPPTAMAGGPGKAGRRHGKRLTGRALRVWERTACLAPSPGRSGRPLSEATAWEFWSGWIGGGQARWVCTGMSYTGGGSAARAVLIDRRGARDTGRCDARRPVGGSWWRSARGDWYHLAAAARGLTPQVKGPFRAWQRRSRLLISIPAEPRRRPTGRVKLTARPDSP
ncbi:hypothetical protein [Actinomadura sp. SCN-SB]|uniref:hypothetical protein n=1 Tax=Actinomadura sp. SCN-SB TaxID=3373092 RepID=UPI0037517AE9